MPSGAWKGSTHGAQVSLMFWIDTFGLILLGIQLVKKFCQIYQVDLVDIISTRTEKVGFWSTLSSDEEVQLGLVGLFFGGITGHPTDVMGCYRDYDKAWNKDPHEPTNQDFMKCHDCGFWSPPSPIASVSFKEGLVRLLRIRNPHGVGRGCFSEQHRDKEMLIISRVSLWYLT